MSNNIKEQDADKQGANQQVKSEKREIIEDGKTQKDKPAVDTKTEKEASYKHENGNPQATQAENLVNKQGEEKRKPVDNPKQEVGSNG